MGSIVSLGQKRDVPSLFYQGCYYLIAGILCLSGLAKIMDPGPLLETLAVLTFLPEAAFVLMATLLPVAEIGLAVLMLLRIQPEYTLSAVSILFVGFLLFSIYGVAAGLDTDCGCFGSAMSSEFGPGMVIRNAAFAGLAGWLLYGNKNNKLERKRTESTSVRRSQCTPLGAESCREGDPECGD